MDMENSSIYRLGRVPQKVIYALLFTLVVVVIVLLLPANNKTSFKRESGLWYRQEEQGKEFFTFNSTYPLSSPRRNRDSIKFKIGIISDQDEKSKASDEDYTWYSILKTGILTYTSSSQVDIYWKDEIKLTSHLSEKGRGVELSELIAFDGKLLSVDDRSGIVYEINHNQLIPWVKLNDGPGDVGKGFKAEWMAIKDNHLYVGGLGKEWTSPSGQFINDYPQYVKYISSLGHVVNLPWASNYNAMKHAAGIQSPGYIIHESACWSDTHRKWFFLPRRASHEIYNDVDDEHRATNLLIMADESFNNIQTRKITKFDQYKGFSSFKFIPGTDDEVVIALKTKENKGMIASYILAFDLNGKILMDEKKIGDVKFEGVEFL